MPTPPQTGPIGPQPSLHFDWQEWLPLIEASDLTEEQKREMLETLWSIVIAFVDLGWDVVPPQGSSATKETCGQVLDLTAALNEAVVNWENTDSINLNPGGPDDLVTDDRGVAEV